MVQALGDKFGREAVPVQIPIGSESAFEGVVDLVHEKAYRFQKDGNGQSQAEELPQELVAETEEWRNRLIEAVAETDDQLMETFFEAGSLSQEQLETGLRKAVRRRRLFPITVSASLHGIGPSVLLDSLVDLVPNPLERPPFPATSAEGEAITVTPDPDAPFATLVFKTLSDPFSGKISILRVVTGTMPADSPAWNSRLQESGKVGHLMLLEGKQGTQVPQLVTGDIGGVAKLKQTATGDTLCAANGKVGLGFVPIPEPAMSFACSCG